MEVSGQLHAPAALLVGNESPVSTGKEKRGIPSSAKRLLASQG
jgi:hypothetical protein